MPAVTLIEIKAIVLIVLRVYFMILRTSRRRTPIANKKLEPNVKHKRPFIGSALMQKDRR